MSADHSEGKEKNKMFDEHQLKWIRVHILDTLIEFNSVKLDSKKIGKITGDAIQKLSELTRTNENE